MNGSKSNWNADDRSDCNSNWTVAALMRGRVEYRVLWPCIFMVAILASRRVDVEFRRVRLGVDGGWWRWRGFGLGRCGGETEGFRRGRWL